MHGGWMLEAEEETACTNLAFQASWEYSAREIQCYKLGCAVVPKTDLLRALCLPSRQ